MDFLKKFFIEGFSNGDYTYGTTHIICLTLMILSCVICPIVFKRMEKNKVIKVLRILGIIMLSIYVTRRMIRVFMGTNIFKALYPFYLCNVSTILVSVVAIRGKYTKWANFPLICGFLGGIITFCIPDGIFSDKYLNFNVLDSVTSHWGIILIPLCAWIKGINRPKLKDIWIVYLGLLIIFINVEVIQKVIFNESFDYLFLDENLPIKIDFMPSYLFVPTLFCLVVFLMHVFFNTVNKKAKLKN